MIPVIAAALAALELAERISSSSIWQVKPDQDGELQRAKVALEEAGQQFAQLCDALGCAHDPGIALETARFVARRHNELLDENTALFAKIDRLEAKAARARKAKA